MEQHTWPRASPGHAFCCRESSSGSTRQAAMAIEVVARRHRDRCPSPDHHPSSSSSQPDCRSRNPCRPRPAKHHTPRHPHHRDAPPACHNGLIHVDFLSSRRSSHRETPEPFCLETSHPHENKQRSSTSNLFSALRTTIAFVPVEVDGSSFSSLPDDILRRIAGSFSWPNLWSASRVCRSWSQALAPLREAMLFVHWGKKFKHGRGAVACNLDKALDSFLKGAVRGCAAAMVDAGLLLWEMGRKEEGIYWYKEAAELGDPAGQCNLGLAYLQDPSDPSEAVKWFQRAALAGHVRAQYSLALCLQQGRGLECSAVKAAHWYQRAAEGGSARAMYNLALCHKKGEGINIDFRGARRWMKRAALSGHRKAQFEHGLTLYAERNGGLALVFLELATRAGETAAIHLRNVLLQQLSPKLRAHAITCADKWQVKLNSPT